MLQGPASAAGQFGVTTAELATENFGTISSLVSTNLADDAPKGIDIGTDNDPEGVLAAAERDAASSTTSFVEVSSRSVSTAVVTETRAVTSHGSTTGTTSSGTSGTSGTGTVAGTTGSTGSSSSTSSSSSGSSSTSGTSTASTGGATQTTTTETPAQEAADCATITAIAKNFGNTTKTIYLTSVPGGAVGAGTAASPLNVYSADRLTAALFPLSNTLTGNMVIHFAAGTYYTTGNPAGWCMSTNWQFLGAGQGQTILKIDPTTALNYTGTDKVANQANVISSNGSGGIVLENMTLDANATGCGSALLAGFTMPAPRGTVMVNVADSTPFVVGKWVYVQDSVATGGVNLYYALMNVISKPDATHLVLQNAAVATAGSVTGTLTYGSPVITGISSMANLEEGQAIQGTGIPSGATIKYIGTNQVTISANATAGGQWGINYGALFMIHGSSVYCQPGNSATGTKIPATAHVLMDVELNGVTTAGGGAVTNITVQNTAMPSYEGGAGILFSGTGTSVTNCTVQSIWGTNYWAITQSHTTGAKITGNKVTGNGYGQGISFIGATGSVIQGNTVTGCTAALFSDTFTKANVTVSGNTFEGLIPINFAGGILNTSTFTNNQCIVTENDGWCLQLVWTSMTGNTFSNNKFLVASGLTGVNALNLNGCTGSSGNVFSGNVWQAGYKLYNLNNTSSYGTQTGNTDTNGNAVSLGLP